jgi:hypothetical protein
MIAIKGSDSVEEAMACERLHAVCYYYYLLSTMLFSKKKVTFTKESHSIVHSSLCSTLDNFSYAVIANEIVNDALKKFPLAINFDICGHSRGGLISVRVLRYDTYTKV